MRFPLKEKCPILTVTLFLWTTDLTLIGSPFTATTKTTEAMSVYRKLSVNGPPFHFLDETKGSPLLIFFGTVRHFSKFFCVQRVFPCRRRPPVTGKGTQHVPEDKIQRQAHSQYFETELSINAS